MSFKSLLIFGKCRGVTKAGTPCGTAEVFGNGFCKHHGGAGLTPFEIRKAHVLVKMKRHTARLERMLDGRKTDKEPVS